ncbi:hypothetical protein [Glycomyces algeriensis]|uniref:Uncharacterized protein n=1 Tax=Glycomyces algeriensis TaxID=256037 RepID=A0A9W6LH74_9ACTN|nr:hypothetical protein [Glycomyces algeriensis]MDA1364253.1 hypothetical protein [Glycomyces algeriensis]MDR7350281.1 hypothetical protein [Glycomyces algeriensis]GLI42990.1 hypothetical protein GALLR39Z86_28400 [Glycomyces algeriensis]
MTSIDNPLRAEMTALSNRHSMLELGGAFVPAMVEESWGSYARVVAAQLASLASRGHLWFFYGGEYGGPRGLQAGLLPDPADDLRSDERQLVDLLFGDARTIRIAQRNRGYGWDDLAAGVRGALREQGLGWLRRDRYRLIRRLMSLRKSMCDRTRSGLRQWGDDPELCRAGVPFAVLFNIDTGAYHWPQAPEEELWVPSMLSWACDMAMVDPR